MASSVALHRLQHSALGPERCAQCNKGVSGCEVKLSVLLREFFAYATEKRGRFRKLTETRRYGRWLVEGEVTCSDWRMRPVAV